jgi:hypothetical protein
LISAPRSFLNSSKAIAFGGGVDGRDGSLVATNGVPGSFLDIVSFDISDNNA